ncbi:hypothetical protein [Streptomyces durhamensis]|uniref:hypothetical protein n=1 Tax=Streptomyces durhamensis TaxID=68194 RepID=UPI0004CDC149|nr:hypothetical protein [Streptomyces durhamensis]
MDDQNRLHDAEPEEIARTVAEYAARLEAGAEAQTASYALGEHPLRRLCEHPFPRGATRSQPF